MSSATVSPRLQALDFADDIKRLTDDFVGREWVFVEIDHWLADPSLGRIFLLTGGPGSGKTAVAARLAQMSLGQAPPYAPPHLAPGSLAYCHFCQAQTDATVNPLRFVESLSAALANRYPRFAKALARTAEHHEINVGKVEINVGAAADSHITGVAISVTINNLSARAAFDLTVRGPLEALCTPDFKETIVVLVDSMDEALAYNPEENIPQLLADATSSPQNLPGKVRFLLTSRPDPSILAMLGEPALDLLENAPPDANEVYDYAKYRLRAYLASADVALRIAEAEKGNFLYARYLLDELLDELKVHPDALIDLTTRALPDGLDGVYRQFIRRELGGDRERWAQRSRPVLALLTVARGQGLTRSQLAAVAEQFYGLLESRANDALDRCVQYLVGPQPDGPFNIYDRSFRQFLSNDREYQVYPAEANQALGTFFLEEHNGHWLDCQERYALEHTPAHLTAAVAGSTRRHKRQALADKLGALLADFDYLEAKTWQLGVSSLLTDLQGAVGPLPGDDEPGASLTALLKAVSAEAASLTSWDRARNSALFAQQVHNRSVLLGLSKLSNEAATRLKYLNRPYLELLWYAPLGALPAESPGQGRVSGFRAGVVTPLGRWPVLIPSHDQPTAFGSDVVTIDIGLRIDRLMPGASIIGDRGGKAWLNDPATFVRDWASHVSQALVVTTPNRGRVIAALRDGRLRVLDARTGQEQGMLAGHATTITALATTRDGRRLVSGSIDGVIKIWNLDANLEEHVLAGHGGSITALAIGSTDDLIVSASADGTLKGWDLASRDQKNTLAGHGDAVLALALTRDGQTAISASADRTLKAWDLAAAREQFTLSGHEGAVLSVALTPDGRHVISASQDGTLKIWNLDSREAEHTLRGHADAVHTVLVTSDGSRAVSAADDGTLRVWDIETGREVGNSDVEPFAMQLLRSGAQLAVTRWWSNRLEIWDITTPEGSSPTSFAVMDQDLGHLAWSSDGETLLSGDEMGAVSCLRYVKPTISG